MSQEYAGQIERLADRMRHAIEVDGTHYRHIDGMVVASWATELDTYAATLKAAQGGVTEAMVERYKVLHQEGMDRHVESERAAGRTPQLQSAIDAGIRHALAALSAEPAAFTDEDRVLSAINADPGGAALQFAEPAAQGEEGFDARKYVRHMADVLEAGGDLFKVDADLLRLAAAINKAANIAQPAQPAERVPDVGELGWSSPTGHVESTASENYRKGWNECRALFLKRLTAAPAPSESESEGGKGAEG